MAIALSVWGWVWYSSLFKPFYTVKAGIAASAGSSLGVRVIAGDGHAVIHAKAMAGFYDLGFGHLDQGGFNGQDCFFGDPCFGGQIGHGLEGIDKFRAAVRVAGKINGSNPDIDGCGLENFSPCHGIG